ncbi:MAG: hypothetical protein A2928_03000 [Candidatus Taylorbacteria bacterium RIFCSPLOWO2_01_FULL_45_15b]|uniref:Type II toxin-antitoxin system HicA family toxin n=1 Tax=Candidatus Taylorbacteria bacterium RIFCSPLOWO2_01_FULL_45_15b TaxID=1802319 RepID=A0A1G2NCI2_9BACT|nr:MAG: hypothetical protein A2928_03000 [Candidatus Taylorbacteria bacterium RIFCSPLOWO2_01_FULL_45_15b]
MPKLRRLSGKQVVKVFEKFGFDIVAQKGSHIKLRRVVSSTVYQTITISNHSELDRGTSKAIFNQALRYIPDQELRKEFYTK